jgi:DNA-binding transcriptional LysR family regulator
MSVFDALVCKYATQEIGWFIMDKWTEFKTAYRLAKHRTLSATANDLGIHRSTVMRHIDTLEQELGLTLFQRNDKGYIPIETGLEVMRLGEITDTQLNQFVNTARNKDDVIEGLLKITSVPEISLLLFPTINQYLANYPNVNIDVIGDLRNFDLEYGEADIAIRAGNKPETLDNVVIPFVSSELVFCAHTTYVETHGMPNLNNVHQHKFLANNERVEHLYWNEWVHDTISKENISLSTGSQQVLNYALYAVVGIGWSTKETEKSDKELHWVDIGESWQINTWILAYRDIVNLPKVRKFIDMLKEFKSPGIKFSSQTL